MNPKTNTIYVAVAGDNKVAVVSGRTNTVTATIPTRTEPGAVAVNAKTNTIFVTHFPVNLVSVISGRTNTVTATIGVGTPPAEVAVNPKTNTAYVTEPLRNTVLRSLAADEYRLQEASLRNHRCGHGKRNLLLDAGRFSSRELGEQHRLVRSQWHIGCRSKQLFGVRLVVLKVSQVATHNEPSRSCCRASVVTLRAGWPGGGRAASWCPQGRRSSPRLAFLALIMNPVARCRCCYPSGRSRGVFRRPCERLGRATGRACISSLH